jgi:hypothetical protein
MRHRAPIAIGLYLLAGCQDPFGSDRHDLLGDRVAAVLASPAGGPAGTTVVVNAALTVDGRLWSDEPVDLAWAWTDSVADVTTLSASDAVETGVDASLRIPSAGAVLGLVATFPSGFVEYAALEMSDLATLPVPLSAPLTDATTVVRDDIVEVDVPGYDGRIRYMSVGGRGTFVETSATAADLTIAEIVFDDAEEQSRTQTEEGALTILALGLGNGNALRAQDLWVGTPPPGIWLADGRFLPSDVDVIPGQDVRLGVDDDASWGLRITAVRSSEGTDTLDLDDVMTGRFQRYDYDGRWVQLP